MISEVALFWLCLISSLRPSIILLSMQCLPLFSALFADKQQRLSHLQRLQGAIFSRLFSGKFTQIKAIAITVITGSNVFPTFLRKVYSNQSYRHYSDYREQLFPNFSPESLLKSKLLPLQRLQGAIFYNFLGKTQSDKKEVMSLTVR